MKMENLLYSSFLILLSSQILLVLGMNQSRKIDVFLTNLYKMHGDYGLLIKIPKQNATNPSELKTLFEQSNLVTSNSFLNHVSWDHNTWNAVYQSLFLEDKVDSNLSSHEKIAKYLSLSRDNIAFDQLPALLQNAKELLKSFLPIGNLQELNFIVKGSSLRRLFTYAKLEQVIKEKKLSHIQLPRKYLMIKDTKSKNYITKKSEAEAILNNIIKIFVSKNNYGPTAHISYEQNSNYELFIFAEKKQNAKVSLNDDAFNELKTLVLEAPFDIGNDNIFTDPQGNATIIDTEYKGEDADSSLLKLNRYRAPKKE